MSRVETFVSKINKAVHMRQEHEKLVSVITKFESYRPTESLNDEVEKVWTLSYAALIYIKKRLLEAVFTRHKKWSFSLRISLVNVTKSVGNYGFDHISWGNP